MPAEATERRTISTIGGRLKTVSTTNGDSHYVTDGGEGLQAYRSSLGDKSSATGGNLPLFHFDRPSFWVYQDPNQQTLFKPVTAMYADSTHLPSSVTTAIKKGKGKWRLDSISQPDPRGTILKTKDGENVDATEVSLEFVYIPDPSDEYDGSLLTF